MMTDHIDRAVAETCPHGRKTCIMAVLGCCAAVDQWSRGHRSAGDTFAHFEPRGGDHENVRPNHANDRVDTSMHRRWAYRF